MDNIKKLSAKWVCHDLRPFCMLEDVGFRILAQELVNIGMFILVFNCQNVIKILFYQDINMVLLTSMKYLEVASQLCEQYMS